MEIERELFEPLPGCSREIGFYLAGIEDVRNQWRRAVADLTKAELASKILPGVQPIGTLILHIAEAEYWWIQCIVNGKSREQAKQEVNDWDIPEDFDFSSRGYDVEYCFAEVEKVNRMTRQFLGALSDSNLEKYYLKISGGKTSEFSLRWILHHLIDHEATHKGQILMIKRLLQSPQARGSAT